MAKIDKKTMYSESNNFEEWQAFIKTATIDDLVNPEVWSEISEDEATELKKWLNDFIKQNAELPEEYAGMIAYPFIDEKLSRVFQKVTLKMQAKRTSEMLKNNTGVENAV